MDELHPLHRYRNEHALSRRELATRLGVSEMSVWRWESGMLLPKRGHWATIKSVTGLDPAAFIPFVMSGYGRGT